MALTETQKTAASQALWDRARRVLAGGVNSPVRAFKAVGGTPLFIRAGQGPYLFDEDDNRYLDFCNSWGPLILGHAHPEVVAAVSQALERGTSFGAPCALEVELAEKVSAWVPGAEMLRFVGGDAGKPVRELEDQADLLGRGSLEQGGHVADESREVQRLDAVASLPRVGEQLTSEQRRALRR